ncbi:MAG: right-handed parallel beta-helix repeat-containing protein [Planctomycetota bacterium]
MKKLLICITLAASIFALPGGCKKKKKKYFLPFGDPPVVSSIPDQQALTNVLFSFDVAPYVTDNDNTIDELAFNVISGSGSFTNSTYTNTFTVSQNELVDFTVSDPGGNVVQSFFLVSVYDTPAADFAADVTDVTEGGTVNFTDLSAGLISTYSWDFDGDNVYDSNDQNPSFQYNVSGLYTVTLNVSGYGGEDNEVKVDYIFAGTPPQANFTADQTAGRAPHTVNFTDTSTGDPSNWAWDFDCDGTIDSTVQNPSCQYDCSGTYSVSLTAGRPGAPDSMITMADYIFVSDNVWYVDGSVGASGDGASWDNAFKTIQEGLDNADSGHLVLVADGTYSSAGDITLNFGAKDIYLKSQNGANTCIIDPQYANFAFGFMAGETQAAIVEGFTIQHGSEMGGGGIYLESTSSPTVKNCVIQHCVAIYGAGVYSQAGSNPVFVNCVFDNNVADRGAAIYGYGPGSIEMTDCTVKNNIAMEYGGGILVTQANVSLIRCSFLNNYADMDGGGMYLNSSLLGNLADCVFDNNIAWVNGGGLYCNYSTDLIMDNCIIQDSQTIIGGGSGVCTLELNNLTMTNCVIDNNYSGDDNGGGIWADYTDIYMDNCDIINNYCDNQQFGAGAYTYGNNCVITNTRIMNNTCTGPMGGIYATAKVSGVLENCVITHNQADENIGGAELHGDGTGVFSVTNCAFSHNYSGLEIGGIRLRTASVTMKDCVIDNNWAAGGDAGGIYIINSTLAMNDSEVTNNLMDYKSNEIFGAGMRFYNATMALNNCSIMGNLGNGGTSDTVGGGIFMYNSSGTIDACKIAGNTVLSASSGGIGAGIHCSYSAPVITKCYFDNNSASWYGGALSCNQYFDGTNSPILSHCTITNNIAGNGSAIRSTSCVPQVLNCLITNNKANENGTIYAWGGEMPIVNCTIAANEAVGKGGALFMGGTGVYNVYNTIMWGNIAGNAGSMFLESVIIDVDNCCFDNSAGAVFFSGGTYNANDCITSSPVFTSLGTPGIGGGGDYHIDVSSPCIDTGGSAILAIYPIIYDMDGDFRIIFGSTSFEVDMGADEYSP